MVLPHLLRGNRCKADAIGDGAGVPWLADTKAVHLADLHICHHLRRRYGDQRHVFVRMYSARAEPIARPHRVRAGRKRHRESHRRAGLLGLFNQGLERLRRLRAFRQQLLLQCNRLTVAIEDKRNDQVLLR